MLRRHSRGQLTAWCTGSPQTHIFTLSANGHDQVTPSLGACASSWACWLTGALRNKGVQKGALITHSYNVQHISAWVSNPFPVFSIRTRKQMLPESNISSGLYLYQRIFIFNSRCYTSSGKNSLSGLQDCLHGLLY